MNFGELKSECRAILFPEGEQENLVPAHDRFFASALWDLQKNVVCYQFNNTDVYRQCATYFSCGMTVLPAPLGQILRVYAIGKEPTDAQQHQSSSSSSSLNQIIGQDSFNVAIFGGTLSDQLICTVQNAGTYTITVANKYTYNGDLNAPQYLRTTIKYTDSNGDELTVQPAADARLDGVEKTGSVTVQIAAGSTIKATMAPFNTPYTDGGFDITVTVRAGESSSGGSTSSTSTSGKDDWCSKIYYEQVDFAHIENYVRLSRRCGSPNILMRVADALIFNLFGCSRWRIKHRYPCPADEGLQSLPTLPMGFHYPQTSTDAGGRSRGGVFAVYRGRIYVAPWIESNETLIIEWNGIKNKWSDDDLVDDGEKFREAVRLNVQIQHYTHYEQNPQKLADLRDMYLGIPGRPGVLQDLINECRKQNQVRSENQAGLNGSEARGLGGTGGTSGSGSSALFYNDAQQYTASCPAGQIGTPVTITIPAGQVGSTMSVADANAKALAQAVSQANSALVCAAQSTTTFYNTAQTYTASCPGASGNTPAAVGTSVTITVPAGSFSSVVSQTAADAAALAAAKVQAEAQLACTFYNGPQTYKASCPAPTSSPDVTVTIPAATFSSLISQADADAQALAAAQQQATAQLNCGAGSFIIGNTEQTYTKTGLLFCQTISSKPSKPFVKKVVIPVNTYTAVVSTATQGQTQLELNQQAFASAMQQAQNAYDLALANFQFGCSSFH